MSDVKNAEKKPEDALGEFDKKVLKAARTLVNLGKTVTASESKSKNVIAYRAISDKAAKAVDSATSLIKNKDMVKSIVTTFVTSTKPLTKRDVDRTVAALLEGRGYYPDPEKKPRAKKEESS